MLLYLKTHNYEIFRSGWEKMELFPVLLTLGHCSFQSFLGGSFPSLRCFPHASPVPCPGERLGDLWSSFFVQLFSILSCELQPPCSPLTCGSIAFTQRVCQTPWVLPASHPGNSQVSKWTNFSLHLFPIYQGSLFSIACCVVVWKLLLRFFCLCCCFFFFSRRMVLCFLFFFFQEGW